MVSGRAARAEGGSRQTAARIRVGGTVQGVGFRPFVHRLASRMGLAGRVWNDTAGVVIEVAGPERAIERFAAALRDEAPPAAVVEAVLRSDAPGPIDARPGFRIVASRERGRAMVGVGPDLATCPGCLSEILDVADRRHHYAFTNCTSCGPRLSILEGVPYDRPRTTMADFAMCPACRREYDDPADRRFHAEPNACPACGPSLRLRRFDRVGDDLLTSWALIREQFWSIVEQGGIVAIKGIGGHHLTCLATDEATVRRLRERKRRAAKPLAVMAASVEVLRRHLRVSPVEAQALGSAAAPILLLRPHGDSRVAPSVAPELHRIGAMLPHAPLHHLLLEGRHELLVMTSGNLSDWPQITDDREAADTLGRIADALLTHDRRIALRVDDSVIRFDGRAATPLRLGRGFAPVRLQAPPGLAGVDAVALGAQLKATFCLRRRDRLVLSPHIGDLEHATNLDAFEACLDHFLRLYALEPEVVAVDLHPDLGSTRLGERLAERCRARLVRVQHHHAHAVACLVEHGWPVDGPPALAIVLDGLGYGPDGTFWGGEILAVDYAACRRLAHLVPVTMPGGAAAIREPWRMAAAHLARVADLAALRRRFPDLPLFRRHGEAELGLVLRAAARGINAPLTTSMGRLFDAVAALVGLADRAGYEGQAAAELEAALWRKHASTAAASAYPLTVREADPESPLPTIDPATVWRPLLEDLAAGRPLGELALRFHLGVVDALETMTEHLDRRHPELRDGPVVLSGGVFQNAFLLRALRARWGRRGRRVLTHRRLPPNDGGLAAGQVAIAAAVDRGMRSACA